jgi:hypothetical protein
MKKKHVFPMGNRCHPWGPGREALGSWSGTVVNRFPAFHAAYSYINWAQLLTWISLVGTGFHPFQSISIISRLSTWMKTWSSIQPQLD